MKNEKVIRSYESTFYEDLLHPFSYFPLSLPCSDHPTIIQLYYYNSLLSIYPTVFFFIFWYLFIYLAAPGLSCGMRDLHCGTWNLVPWPGIEPQAPCIGNAESSLLDHQESPYSVVFCWTPLLAPFYGQGKVQTSSSDWQDSQLS